jgi:hypothetical protein
MRKIRLQRLSEDRSTVLAHVLPRKNGSLEGTLSEACSRQLRGQHPLKEIQILRSYDHSLVIQLSSAEYHLRIVVAASLGKTVRLFSANGDSALATTDCNKVTRTNGEIDHNPVIADRRFVVIV